MKHHLTAGIVSVGIALAGITATPGPARADNGNIAIIVGGAIALLALKEILEGNAKADDRRNDHGKNNNKPSGNYWQKNRVVPSQCYYRYASRSGLVGVFGEGCMKSVMGSVRHLPSACRYTGGKQFSGAPAYGARCLQDRGYRVEARRY